MRRKARKLEIDQQLLDTIYKVQREWQQIESFVENSVEPSNEIIYTQNLAQAKYLFLLREARHRNVNASRYS
ncbi:MAG TPA: YaaL family protein [Virgibacillus sp.]|nr:YaaL family protein [Virgibacillus sp.]